MAAELKLVEPDTKVTLIHSRDRLLSAEPLPDDSNDQTLSLPRKDGVEVITGKQVLDIHPCSKPNPTKPTLKLSDGTEHCASFVINAVSKPVPTTSYLPPATLDNEKLVNVTSTLHSPDLVSNLEHHIAIGDLKSWPGNKRCGTAMHMAPFAAFNLHQTHAPQCWSYPKVEYKEFPIHPPGVALALGKTAIGVSGETCIHSGEDLMQRMFVDDLGLGICWEHLGLGQAS